MAKRRLPQPLEPEELRAVLAVPNRKVPTGLRNRTMVALSGIRLRDVVVQDSDTKDWVTLRGFEADTAEGTILAPLEYVEEWGPIRPLNEAETKVIADGVAAQEAKDFLRRHRIDERGFHKLMAKQRGICPSCKSPLVEGNVHVEDGTLRHGYPPCSTIRYTV